MCKFRVRKTMRESIVSKFIGLQYLVVLHAGVDMNFLRKVRTMHHRRNLTEIRKKSGL
jgi:hypothetical protein